MFKVNTNKSIKTELNYNCEGESLKNKSIHWVNFKWLIAHCISQLAALTSDVFCLVTLTKATVHSIISLQATCDVSDVVHFVIPNDLTLLKLNVILSDNLF